MCKSISSISPSSRSWRPMVGENTSRFLPPAAASPIRTASAGSQSSRVTVQERDSLGGRRVVGVVREHEERSVPGAAVDGASQRHGRDPGSVALLKFPGGMRLTPSGRTRSWHGSRRALPCGFTPKWCIWSPDAGSEAMHDRSARPYSP